MIDANPTWATAANDAIEFDESSSLRAALSVIDDWDIDFGFLFESDPLHQQLSPPQDPPTASHGSARRHSRTSSPSSVTKSSLSATPYTGRNRRKLEIQALREQSIELERQLERAQRAAEAAANEIPTPESEMSKQLTAAWEQFAVSQRSQREVVEGENAKLREAIGTLAKLARQLFNTSRRVRVPQGLLPTTSMDSLEFDWQTMTTADHLMELDKLYTDMPSIFDKPCFTSGRREFQEIEIVDKANEHLIKFDIALVLPFEPDRVAEALWQQTVRMSSSDRVYEFKDLITDSSTMMSLFAGISTMSCFEGTMQGQIATRRYSIGETREIVSKVVTDTLMRRNEPMTMVGEGWLRCTPIHQGISRSSGDGTTSPLTQVHWHRRIRVQTSNTSASVALPFSTDEMESSVRQTVTWNLQSVENQLITQTRRKHQLPTIDLINPKSSKDPVV